MAQVVVTLPDQLADLWDRETLPRAILEALAIESYRSERLTHGEIGPLLGLTFAETETFLQARGVPLHYDLHDLEADRRDTAAVLRG